MSNLNRSLSLLEGSYAICRLDKDAPVPDWATAGELFSATRTPDELSIVCIQDDLPRGLECELGWRCLKVESPFRFDLSGTICALFAPLAEAGLDLFVVATKDSDYLMIRESDPQRTLSTLSQAGDGQTFKKRATQET